MRKLLYIVLFLSVGKHLQATNYNCHTEAGQLQSLIGEQHRIITNLTVSGTIDGRTIYQKQGKTTEAKIDTQSYSGEVFILSVQIESGKYYHLKLGRVN